MPLLLFLAAFLPALGLLGAGSSPPHPQHCEGHIVDSQEGRSGDRNARMNTILLLTKKVFFLSGTEMYPWVFPGGGEFHLTSGKPCSICCCFSMLRDTRVAFFFLKNLY